MQTTEKFIESNGYKTWVGVYGDIESGKTPLLAIHDGPGFPHYHLQNLSGLADRGIPVVMYDQLGCGKSDRPDNLELWTLELFIDELVAVREAIGLERMHLLGHSWGASLAVEYLLTKPVGVQRLILSSPLLDTGMWVEETDKLRDQLPDGIADIMRRHEAAEQQTLMSIRVRSMYLMTTFFAGGSPGQKSFSKLSMKPICKYTKPCGDRVKCMQREYSGTGAS